MYGGKEQSEEYEKSSFKLLFIFLTSRVNIDISNVLVLDLCRRGRFKEPGQAPVRLEIVRLRLWLDKTADW